MNYVALGGGAVPQGSPAALAMGLATDAKTTTGGFVAATAYAYDPAFSVRWLDASGTATRTESMTGTSGASHPSVVTANGITYVSWVRTAFSTGDSHDALWNAGYSAAGVAFAPKKLRFLRN